MECEILILNCGASILDQSFELSGFTKNSIVFLVNF